MASLAQIRDGIATTLTAAITGLRVYARVPDQPIAPCVIVEPTEANFDVAMGRGEDTWTLQLHVLVSGGDTEVGQRNLDPYVTGAGSSSIRAALFRSTLGLSGTDAHVTEMTAYGFTHEANDIAHLGATLLLTVHTSGTG